VYCVHASFPLNLRLAAKFGLEQDATEATEAKPFNKKRLSGHLSLSMIAFPALINVTSNTYSTPNAFSVTPDTLTPHCMATAVNGTPKIEAIAFHDEW
jgi:hypothetical protein